MQSINIEIKLIAWLSQRVSTPVFAEVPNDTDAFGDTGRPEEFITVERTGGARDSEIIDRASIAIQCWSTSRSLASKLAYAVDDTMNDFVEAQGIARVQRNGLYNFPDQINGTTISRYQILFDITTTL